jgi:hypothetical protein
MSKFLAGDELSIAIKKIMSERPARCAVAFWGEAAKGLIDQIGHCDQVQIICNLFSGGTDPYAIEYFLNKKRIDVRRHDALHAKVYIGQKDVIVTSANASANGWGYEDQERMGWQEAGVLIPLSTEVSEWYLRICSESKIVSKDDLERAKRSWDQRPKTRTLSILPSDPGELDKYLVCWTDSKKRKYKVNKDEVRKQLGDYNDQIEDWIGSSLQTEGEGAEEILKGRWILWWLRNKNGGVLKGSLWWSRTTDTVIRKAKLVDGVLMDVVLGNRDPGPDPFDANDDDFYKAFSSVMARKEFKDLREGENDLPWFNARRAKDMKKLWRFVRDEYLKIYNERLNVRGLSGRYPIDSVSRGGGGTE